MNHRNVVNSRLTPHFQLLTRIYNCLYRAKIKHHIDTNPVEIQALFTTSERW